MAQTSKKTERHPAIRIVESAIGGLIVSLANMGAEYALRNNEKGIQMLQFMPAVTGAIGGASVWLGGPDVQDIGLGVIGASADRATDELAAVFQGFSRKSAMNGNVNQEREYQEVMKERPDFNDVENKVGDTYFSDAEIIEEDSAM